MLEQSLLNNLMGCYITLAVTYNLISLLCKEITGKGFSATDPVHGILMMVVLYCSYLLLESMFYAAGLSILATYTFLIAQYGIIRHVLSYNSEDYLSRWSWALAIGINIFGVGVLFLTLAQIIL